MDSPYNVNQAKQEVSDAVHFIEQNIFLALGAVVALLIVIFFVYVINEYAQSNRPQQANVNHFLSLIVLVVGMGMFCSSCGVAQEMQATPSGITQAQIQSGCPYHEAHQEPVALASIYRTIGYPAQRITTCKFCEQRLVNPRD